MSAGSGAQSDFLDRVEDILREVRSLDASARADAVRERCGDDERLLHAVEFMLEAEAQVDDDFLKQSVAEQLQSRPQPPVHRVGPWEIAEPLGVGGMGAVFRARRADGAFEQEVAVKFIHAALLNSAARSRFLRERQILATLNHPGIAPLLDGGVTERGQPYLVMQLVDGQSLLEYCDARRLTLQKRLELFDHVCAAVQHAHSNLVVHRDLKPSNILVDQAGRPQLVDFGIASMLSDTGSTMEAAVATATGQPCFTPQYAAPEQVRGEPVTVATDVYALGVILYELLTGARPYEVTGLHSPQDTRAICDTDPPRPSRRLDTTENDPTADIAEISRARSIDPHRLKRALRGDLDHIVLMALRKEPGRRYATASALREDIRNYLRGLPVAARPDSWGYRTTRFVKRHRLPVAAAVALAVVILAAAVISTILAVRLSEQSAALHTALSQRQAALEAAEARQAALEREFRRSLSSGSILINMLAAVSSADESMRESIIAELRSRVDRLDAITLPLSVDAEIATRQALAMLARAIEAFDIALEQNRRVLALTDGRPEETTVRAETFSQIGWLHLQQGDAESAVAAFREARALDQRERNPRYITVADVQLIEALLMLEEIEAARQVLAEGAFPPPPTAELMRESVRDLEVRFGVGLLANEGD